MNDLGRREGAEIRALVLAAGYGTRLAPVTDFVPKPLLPLGRGNLLDAVIGKLCAAGITQIGVNSHHLGQQIKEYTAENRAGHPAQLTHFPETEILGTGGALANAREFLAATPEFLVHNGDVLCDAELAGLISAHRNSSAIATLLLVDWPAVNSVRLGVDGAIRHIGGAGGDPTPIAGDRAMTYAGIAIFNRELLAAIEPGFSSLIDPLIRALKSRPGSVRGYAPESMSWDDLGTLGRWLAAADVAETVTPSGAPFQLARITGHGSDRRFWRLSAADWSAVAMVSPPADDEFERFLAIGRFLEASDLGPARFLTVDEPGQAVLMEDLGSDSLYALATQTEMPTARLEHIYELVVDHLLALQGATVQAREHCPQAVDRTLDRAQLRWETDYFSERFLQGHLGLKPAATAELTDEFASLAASVASAPLFLIHRDFQSQNVILQEDEVRLVDYQGIRLGPLAYDLASLLWDPYVRLPDAMKWRLVDRFAAGCEGVEASDVRQMTIAAGLQRVMQALGAYGFLGHIQGKLAFLNHIPAGVANLKMLLSELAVEQTEATARSNPFLPPPLPKLTRLVGDIMVDCEPGEIDA